MSQVAAGLKHSMQAVAGSAAGRSLLRAAVSVPVKRGKVNGGQAFRLAKRAHYGSATFRYERAGCAPLELNLAGAALDLFYLGDYEPESLGPMVRLARGARTFLDIGSQAGVYSMVIASANPDIEVIAFEADPRSVAIVLDNAARNKGRPGVGSVAVCAAAVAKEPGLAAFHLAGGNSSLNAEFRAGTQELLCPTVSIDSFLESIGHGRPVDLVKIDTESTEPAVLRGMANTIERWRPVITLEVLRSRTEAALDLFLSQHDYRALWLTKTGLRTVATVAGDPAHSDLNYLFVPDEKWAEVTDVLDVTLG